MQIPSSAKSRFSNLSYSESVEHFLAEGPKEVYNVHVFNAMDIGPGCPLDKSVVSMAAAIVR